MQDYVGYLVAAQKCAWEAVTEQTINLTDLPLGNARYASILPSIDNDPAALNAYHALSAFQQHRSSPDQPPTSTLEQASARFEARALATLRSHFAGPENGESDQTVIAIALLSKLEARILILDSNVGTKLGLS